MKIGPIAVLVGLAALNFAAQHASAQVLIYNGTGTNAATATAVSFQAQFQVLNAGLSNSLLQIKLINTTTANVSQDDLLSGLFFNISGVTTTPTNNSTAGVTTALVASPDAGQLSTVANSNGNTIPDQSVDGSYVFGDFTALSGADYQYGINASGFTGGTPAYSFSGFTLGGVGIDYAVRPNTAQDIGGPTTLVIDSEVLLTLSGFGTGLTSTSQLSNIGFAVGSTSQNVNNVQTNIIIPGTTPEPGSVGLLVGLATSGALYARRKRRIRPKK
jgi:hypothetical protein